MKRFLAGLFILMAAFLIFTNVVYADGINHTTTILPPGKVPNFPTGKITYADVYPVFARNCASCHNETTPGRNWLKEADVFANRSKMYRRVFIQGDMPLFFRFFGGSEKQLLKRYLEQSYIILGD